MSKKKSHTLSTDLDKAVYQTLKRRIPPNSYSEYLEDIVNALMNATLNGELYVDLKGKMPIKMKGKGWPKQHREELILSGWLDGNTAPIVLHDELLSWRRNYTEVKEITQRLLNKTKLISNRGISKTTYLPENTSHNLNKDQLSAVNAIENHSVLLLSGGPGTGKTSTVVQILARALSIKPNIRVGLAAPTGKASRRLRDTLEKGINAINLIHPKTISEFQCDTLHKWLEAKPGGFRKNKNNLLNLDLLIIDEMSMVDICLMKGLLDALPDKSQLVLVGDPDQLPPIGSPSIWEELQKEDIRSKFQEGAIHLDQLYRNNGALASLSNVLRKDGLRSFWRKVSELPQGDNVSHDFSTIWTIPELVLERLRHHHTSLKRLIDVLKIELQSNEEILNFNKVALTKKAGPLFKCLDELMVLCPRRSGLWSIEHINKAILGKSFEEGINSWVEGTPVICNENQSELGLANGDLGVVVGEGQQKRLLFRVFSQKQELEATLIHPARVKGIEAAFSITIHKAQGSEADQVILLWPEIIEENSIEEEHFENNDRYKKRLIYTAITRARSNLKIIINKSSSSNEI